MISSPTCMHTVLTKAHRYVALRLSLLGGNNAAVAFQISHFIVVMIVQIVLLGAGLDSRAYRLQCLQDCNVFELDTCSVICYKSSILCREGFKPASKTLTRICCDIAISCQPPSKQYFKTKVNEGSYQQFLSRFLSQKIPAEVPTVQTQARDQHAQSCSSQQCSTAAFSDTTKVCSTAAYCERCKCYEQHAVLNCEENICLTCLHLHNQLLCKPASCRASDTDPNRVAASSCNCVHSITSSSFPSVSISPLTLPPWVTAPTKSTLLLRYLLFVTPS